VDSSSAQRLPAPAAVAPWSALSHLPHRGYPPIVVDLALLRDTLGFARGVLGRAGPVSRAMLVGQPQALLMSADGIEAILGDTRARVSAAGGWGPVWGEPFPRELILHDGTVHHAHRRRMLPALRRDALEQHLARMAPRIDAAVAGWRAAGRIDLHEAARRLTLHLASDVFLGIDDPSEVAAAHHDFVQLVDASAAVLRWRVPVLRYGRGLAARRRLAARLAGLIGERRAKPGDELFSQLCVLRDEDDRPFTDDEIVDHMIFLWMAAHDTTRSAITTLVRALALDDASQARPRNEVLDTLPPGDPPTLDGLARLESLG
jgi:cytochrome P450